MRNLNFNNYQSDLNNNNSAGVKQHFSAATFIGYDDGGVLYTNYDSNINENLDYVDMDQNVEKFVPSFIINDSYYDDK